MIDYRALRNGVSISVVAAAILLMLFLQKEGTSGMPVVDDTMVPSTTEARSSGSGSESPSHPAEALIELSDDNPITITWRRRDGARPPIERNEWGYESLKARAESEDEYAAYYLSTLLDQCGQAFESQEQMNSAIDRMEQTHTIVFPDSDHELHINNPERDIPLMSQGIRDLFGTCYGITAEQKLESSSWLQRSAEGGYMPAVAELALNEEDHEIAIRQFTRVWEDGDAEALQVLSQRYYANYQSGVQPTDKIRGYASLYLYARIIEAGMGPGTGHGEIAGRQVQRIQKVLDRATGDMLPHEIDQAIEMARSMIKENDSCCYGM
jgi:hypothetical protein